MHICSSRFTEWNWVNTSITLGSHQSWLVQLCLTVLLRTVIWPEPHFIDGLFDSLLVSRDQEILLSTNGAFIQILQVVIVQLLELDALVVQLIIIDAVIQRCVSGDLAPLAYHGVARCADFEVSDCGRYFAADLAGDCFQVLSTFDHQSRVDHLCEFLSLPQAAP